MEQAKGKLTREQIAQLFKRFVIDYKDPQTWAKFFVDFLTDLRAIEHGADISVKSIQTFINSSGLHEDADFKEFEGSLDKILSVFCVWKISELLNMPEEYKADMVKAEIDRRFGKPASLEKKFLAEAFSLGKKVPPQE